MKSTNCSFLHFTTSLRVFVLGMNTSPLEFFYNNGLLFSSKNTSFLFPFFTKHNYLIYQKPYCYKLWRRNSQHFHYHSKLFFLAFSRKQRKTCEELNCDASIASHIDCDRVRNSKHYFWGSVETGLDISVDFFLFETARTEVNYPYT